MQDSNKLTINSGYSKQQLYDNAPRVFALIHNGTYRSPIEFWLTHYHMITFGDRFIIRHFWLGNLCAPYFSGRITEKENGCEITGTFKRPLVLMAVMAALGVFASLYAPQEGKLVVLAIVVLCLVVFSMPNTWLIRDMERALREWSGRK